MKPPSFKIVLKTLSEKQSLRVAALLLTSDSGMSAWFSCVRYMSGHEFTFVLGAKMHADESFYGGSSMVHFIDETLVKARLFGVNIRVRPAG